MPRPSSVPSQTLVAFFAGDDHFSSVSVDTRTLTYYLVTCIPIWSSPKIPGSKSSAAPSLPSPPRATAPAHPRRRVPAARAACCLLQHITAHGKISAYLFRKLLWEYILLVLLKRVRRGENFHQIGSMCSVICWKNLWMQIGNRSIAMYLPSVLMTSHTIPPLCITY